MPTLLFLCFQTFWTNCISYKFINRNCIRFFRYSIHCIISIHTHTWWSCIDSTRERTCSLILHIIGIPCKNGWHSVIQIFCYFNCLTSRTLQYHTWYFCSSYNPIIKTSVSQSLNLSSVKIWFSPYYLSNWLS